MKVWIAILFLVTGGLGGCASDPDATLLGVVMVPPNALPRQPVATMAADRAATTRASGSRLVQVSASEPSNAASSNSAPMNLASANATPMNAAPDGRPEPVAASGLTATARAGDEAATALAYASAPHTPPLKSEAEVDATEAELRHLADRNAPLSGRGLWNNQIRALLNKRDRHADEAVAKIEQDAAE